jgi:hypothetical protein
MRAGVLLDELTELVNAFGRDIVVDCNDGHGGYSTAKGIRYQEWTDRDGNKHHAVTIIHNGYDSTETIVEKS